MLHITAILCDSLIVATMVGQWWEVTVTDQLSGATEKGKWTSVQMGAVMALATGGDEFSPELTKQLYSIAEPLFDGWDNNVRCIP